MLLNFAAYYLIPASTLLFASHGGWLTTNLSVLGSVGVGRLALFLWGVATGLYFHAVLTRLIPLMGGGRWQWRGMWLALGLLYCTITTPYLPGETPLRAGLHVIMGVGAACALCATMLTLLLGCYRQNRATCRLYFLGMGATGGGVCGMLFGAGMVTSALEVCLVLSGGIMVRRMLGVPWVLR